MTSDKILSDKILVVDCEQQVRWNLSHAIQSFGLVPIEAPTASSALELFDLQRPAATLLDIELPDGSGLDVLREIKKRQPDAIVIIITGKVLVDETIAALRAGAFDFISKPINLEEIRITVRKGIKTQELRREVRHFQREQIKSFSFEKIIGESPAIKETILLAKKVASSDVSCVLLQGESGTGKDLIAKAIHYSSPRARKPFVAINCAAIPANLLESELFGFEKGAFTDAKARKEGLFEQAEGGTLFLDEIGDLDIGLQAKLLRVLEEGSFRRVGGLRDLPLNVRVIAASNRNLRTDAKHFRLDLYYRLSVIQIDLPPLRQRGRDVLLLASHFIKTLDKKWHRTPARKLSPEVEDVFCRYNWAGNVRELRNAIERALILEENELITMKYMPPELAAADHSHSNHLNGKQIKTANSYVSLPPEGISLDLVEESLIQQALERSGGNVTRASELLRVSRDRIRYRLKKNKAEVANTLNHK
jgi:two-component system, NtrC family, response regulator AtoC